MAGEDDDECDYMSDKFVSDCSNTRPGLLWGKHVRAHEKDKWKTEKDMQNTRKPVKVMEREIRDKGLETKLGTENKGFAMLQKMGYKPGEGLGKNKTGRVEPVPISVKANKTGLGKDAQEKRKRETQEKFRAILTHKKRKLNERLQVDFRARMSDRFNEQQYERDLYKSQKVCHQLHCEDGIDNPEFEFFWPAKAFETDEEEDQQQEDKEEEYSTADKLFILTKYLRENYFYCLWCAVRYNDTNDLGNSCPGDTAKDHDD